MRCSWSFMSSKALATWSSRLPSKRCVWVAYFCRGLKALLKSPLVVRPTSDMRRPSEGVFSGLTSPSPTPILPVVAASVWASMLDVGMVSVCSNLDEFAFPDGDPLPAGVLRLAELAWFWPGAWPSAWPPAAGSFTTVSVRSMILTVPGSRSRRLLMRTYWSPCCLARYSIAIFSWSKEYYMLNKLLRSNGKSTMVFAWVCGRLSSPPQPLWSTWV